MHSSAYSHRRHVTEGNENPPLLYEDAFENPPHDTELAKIRLLRSQTRSLVQQLWDAARDIEAVETLAQPIKQYPSDLVRDELASLRLHQESIGKANAIRKTTTVFSPSPSRNTRSASRLSIGRERSRQLYSRSSNYIPESIPTRTFGSNSAAFISSTSKNIQKIKESTARSRPISHSKTPSPTKSINPVYKRPLSPDKVRVLPLSKEDREKMLMQRCNEKADEILQRDDSYFDDISKYRQLYPDLYTRDVPQVSPKFKTSINRSPIVECKPIPLKDDGYYYSGVFRVNERLFPEKLDHPYKSSTDSNVFMLDKKSKYMASNEPPVKVSIPINRISPTQRHYNHHRRSSYDPADSADISAYLHKGYRPYLWSSRMLRPTKEHASLKEEILFSSTK
ncbi:hypothetical protein BATDEDRAFT_22944 [Batrachochytrium dendrobatidis JAM81]|uniref:Uncharacterized protein n=1 Tax=Batrachochytrium dendrobatidis (strain JAM81 / FGSC 10211) TaxID=684364 RepID=F4NW96_BATDJ|nr:uncharacterized protein BATDEDRAFT_22944 [Batrachochytrium dendrobatidis JAM81]EGF82791.1 hypothetical protein BATDEDRAFT_22944 [Batrachochytrium dendrobatidis JAM81]|eukprot:XP_006676671.1 hypothetical protein BATDEDRAFT_22944 [Batrachochytrium dendrobatidis JAM81]